MWEGRTSELLNTVAGETELRKAKEREKKRKQRAILTEDKRNVIQERDRISHQILRSELSEEQRQSICEQNKKAHQQQRATASSERREQIQEQDRLAHQSYRLNQSDDQRERIQEQGRLAHEIQRLNQSDDWREEVRDRDRLAHQIHRLAQPPERRDEVREQDRAAHEQRILRRTPQERNTLNTSRRATRNVRQRADAATTPLRQTHPPEHFLGPMSCNCSHCRAKYFRDEHPRAADGTYNPCCRNGSITMDLFTTFPAEFYDLFTGGHPLSANFLANIRQINNSVAIASMDCNHYNNSWVVPYNPYLLEKYNAHINVEFCSFAHVTKYLFKYCYKGSDKAKLRLRQQQRDLNGGVIDEVEEHLDARYLCPPEGFHHLFAFDSQGRSHPVIDLAVHEENRHSVTFQPGEEAQALTRNRKTTLLAFFELNAKARELDLLGRLEELGPVDPRTVPYNRIPEHFTFIKATGIWRPKAHYNKNIGRVHSAVPSQRARYCTRLLLLHTVGAASFQDLYTVNGVQYGSAYDAARELGLIRSPDHFERAMSDANFYRMPANLRSVFATLLSFDEPQDVQAQWDQWKAPMSEDYVRRGRTPADAEALAFFDIQEMCVTLSVRFSDHISTHYVRPAPMADTSVDHAAVGREMYSKLNPNQKKVVDDALSGQVKLIYLDGPGGSGKTYTYEALYHILKGSGKEVMCCAWTGIAANLLPEGRTLASYFKLNIQQDCETSSLKPNSAEGELMKQVDVFVVDEVSMISAKVIKTIDTVLKDVHNEQALPFGGKTVLIGGDFRQVSPLFRKYQLTENMRAATAAASFKELFLNIGEDKVPKDVEGRIEVPAEMLSAGDLIEEVYGGVFDDPDHLNARAILCPKNSSVDDMNRKILQKMSGPSRVFLSADEIDKENQDDTLTIPDELLHSLTPAGLPHHRLELRIGCVVMLLRNLNVRRGLCNGTRLQVMQFCRNNAILCRFISGTRKGQPVIIPRIDLKSNKSKDQAFILRRRQFPLKLAFSITINKAQGKSLEKVGIYLPEPVFSHGMLYVAMSRARTAEGLKILIEKTRPMTANVVDARALE